MRCNNCGWENPDNLTRCEKCNSPLSSGASNRPAHQQPVQQNFSKTVNEAMVFPDSPVGGANVCPRCGYPMRPGMMVCPNCHYGATEAEAPARPNPTPARSADKRENTTPAQGTVNPWVQVTSSNKCTLEPVAQDGVDNPAILHLKGDAHELNRANLDPENQTITSKVQACLTYEHGQWFIEDRSAQHTTFIHVDKKTALKDGDIILMGNRQFVFHAE
ncbi:MAG: zinc ribbon domain-containing protein [Paludibacteraceae bacterium]|nr:zinc ribbon domain-containing protein [Paludibacteraceae bacterium]